MPTDGVVTPPAPAGSGGVEPVRSGPGGRRQGRDQGRRPAAPKPEDEEVEEIGSRSPSGRLDVVA